MLPLLEVLPRHAQAPCFPLPLSLAVRPDLSLFPVHSLLSSHPHVPLGPSDPSLLASPQLPLLHLHIPLVHVLSQHADNMWPAMPTVRNDVQALAATSAHVHHRVLTADSCDVCCCAFWDSARSAIASHSCQAVWPPAPTNWGWRFEHLKSRWSHCVRCAIAARPAGPLSRSHSPSSWGGALQLLLALLHQAGQPLVVGLL
ncbi:hypothetical protein HaLaN_24342, partial [Haematococcus lacustris]